MKQRHPVKEQFYRKEDTSRSQKFFEQQNGNVFLDIAEEATPNYILLCISLMIRKQFLFLNLRFSHNSNHFCKIIFTLQCLIDIRSVRRESSSERFPFIKVARALARLLPQEVQTIIPCTIPVPTSVVFVMNEYSFANYCKRQKNSYLVTTTGGSNNNTGLGILPTSVVFAMNECRFCCHRWVKQ